MGTSSIAAGSHIYWKSSDPWLRNPAGVNDLSFYAHHLSPHLFLFGAPIVRLFQLNGFEILALHAALFFGLFTAALLWTTWVDADWRVRLLLFLSGAGIGAVSNILFQAAGYPHYEIAMLSVTTLALAAWARGWRRLFIACVAWLPLIREDGGFYAAFVGLASWAVTDPTWRRPAHRSTLLVVIGGGLAASAVSMLIQSQFFPGFDAFAFNFSGQSWSHVSGRFLADRAYAAITNPNIVPVLLGCLVLTYWDVRYAAGFVLLSPLYLLHLLSVREEHGHFTLYICPAVVAARSHLVGTYLATVPAESRVARVKPSRSSCSPLRWRLQSRLRQGCPAISGMSFRGRLKDQF